MPEHSVRSISAQDTDEMFRQPLDGKLGSDIVNLISLSYHFHETTKEFCHAITNVEFDVVETDGDDGSSHER